MCPMDTTPEAWEVYLDIMRKLTPSEKFQRVFELTEIVRPFQLAGLRDRYPNADEHEIFLRFARNNLGAELFERVYGEHSELA